jgi:hypothetical protein
MDTETRERLARIAVEVAQLTRYVQTLVMVLYGRDRLTADDLETLRVAAVIARKEE